jgi:hypothetical protein
MTFLLLCDKLKLSLTAVGVKRRDYTLIYHVQYNIWSQQDRQLLICYKQQAGHNFYVMQ